MYLQAIAHNVAVITWTDIWNIHRSAYLFAGIFGAFQARMYDVACCLAWWHISGCAICNTVTHLSAVLDVRGKELTHLHIWMHVVSALSSRVARFIAWFFVQRPVIDYYTIQSATEYTYELVILSVGQIGETLNRYIAGAVYALCLTYALLHTYTHMDVRTYIRIAYVVRTYTHIT
jgi:hypothetical protein